MNSHASLPIDTPGLANATSAVLTLADLAGSEAATLNTNHAVAQQGLAVNKSLHWLKVRAAPVAAARTEAPGRVCAHSIDGWAPVVA